MGRSWLLLVGLAACATPREADTSLDWFDPGTQIDVVEPIEFTDQEYAFPADDRDGVGGLLDAVFPVPAASGFGADNHAFGPDDQYPSNGDCESIVDTDLPFEIDAVVTVHPRFYFKTSGCSWDSDEKYYGSFFLQDSSGGIFVLGDSKVAHFDMGDRVKVRVRGGKSSFGLDMAYTYDLIEIVERGVPIYYEHATGPLGPDDIGEVRRVTGTVTVPKDTFGEFAIEDANGTEYRIGLDVELNRRGIDFPVGTELTATGPVLFSYEVHTIVIMRRGQITVH